MEEIVSVASLATNAVAIFVVTLIVQYTKGMIPASLNTRVYVLILSLVVLCVGTAFSNPTVEGFILAVFNSIIVSLACMGTYDATFRTLDERKKENING